MRRTPLNRGTPLKPGGELRRATWNRAPQAAASPPSDRKPVPSRRPRDTGPSPQVVALVFQRDEGACVRCGGACHGERGRDWSVQHRRGRGMGSTRRPDTNQPQALILLCGDGATGCHGWVTGHPAVSRDHGWAIRQTDDPLQKPVWHWRYGFIFLTADGAYASRPPAEEATP